MTPRQRPILYWAKARPTPEREGRDVRGHFFRNDQDRAACTPHIVPDLRTKALPSGGLRPIPPALNACAKCVVAWRNGWPYDLESNPQENPTP